MTTYTVDQYDDNYPPGIELHFWNIARNVIIMRLLKRAGMDKWSLLEVGCGRGIIVEYLRDRRIDCIGCELAAAPVPTHLRSFVFDRTNFTDLPEALKSRIRGVLLCDVIEHLPDPVVFLRKVKGTFPALEGVLVTVPARQELWSEWDRHYGHFRRYNLALLRATLNGAGFNPTSVGYFFHGLYLPAFLLRHSKLRSTSVKAPPPFLAWMHALVGAGFRVEERILPSALPGTSVIGTARLTPGSIRRRGVSAAEQGDKPVG